MISLYREIKKKPVKTQRLLLKMALLERGRCHTGGDFYSLLLMWHIIGTNQQRHRPM